MRSIQPTQDDSKVTRELHSAGSTLIHKGKVRDSLLSPKVAGVRCVVTTDRTSAFDFPLQQQIPDKGKILNFINVHWRRKLSDVPNDLLAAGSEVDPFVPKANRNNPELQSCTIIVRDLNMDQAEYIARGIMTGTAWKMYKAGERQLWGYPALPDGMKEWDDLPFAMFTPTNKAKSGHDLPITRESVGPEMEAFTINLFNRGRSIALESGLIIVDTKFEGGKSGKDDRFVLGDEIFTPDSSRYVDASALDLCRREGTKPPSFDKQIIRDYLTHAKLADGSIVDVSQLEPKNEEHRRLVWSIVMPNDIIQSARDRYLELLDRLTGHDLESFGREELGIAA